MNEVLASQAPLIVHGLDLSYFTGKLEAYLRAKGIAYALQEMTTRSFRDCGRATGMQQMPQVQCADGTWLTDTTLIMRYLEATQPEPAITPRAPLVRFVARLIEDFGDESLWRPALYYRWAFTDDARLMSRRLARGMLRDVPLPFSWRRQVILRRQQHRYLRRDGVTRATRRAVERLYLETLTAMETALAPTPFVLGARPCEADFGLFGSMFRHFFSDPTPAKIMREVAPRTLAWVTRLWALSPGDFAAAPAIHAVPQSCQPLLRLVATTHLPYMDANARAVADGAKTVRFLDHGASFETPVSPYRAWCLDQLQEEFSALDPPDQIRSGDLIGSAHAASILGQPRRALTFRPPSLPMRPGGRTGAWDRNGESS